MLHNHSHIQNRLTILTDLTKIDPAGLLSIKYDMSKEIEKRFNWLIEIINEVFERDILKLNNEEPLIGNASSITEEAIKKLQDKAYDFNTSEKKVEGFMDWLEDMEDLSILEKTTRSGRITSGTKRPWSDVYVQSSYQKGIFRARREMESAGVDITKLDNDPNREVDLLFNRPFHSDRAAYLYTRTFNELKGVTKEMDRQLSNILSQGIVDGKNGKVIAKEITSMIPKIGINRARTIARTEIQRAHHQANINEYMNAQIQGVVVLAEWENGANPCPVCSSLSGEVFTLEKIRGMIPAHPNCVCVAIPFQPGIDSVKGAVPSVAGWLPNCSEVMHDVMPSALSQIQKVFYINAAKSCLTPVDKKKVEKATEGKITIEQIKVIKQYEDKLIKTIGGKRSSFEQSPFNVYIGNKSKATDYFTVKTIFDKSKIIKFTDALIKDKKLFMEGLDSKAHTIVFNAITKEIYYKSGILKNLDISDSLKFKNLSELKKYLKTAELPVKGKPIKEIIEKTVKEKVKKDSMENWEIKSSKSFSKGTSTSNLQLITFKNGKQALFKPISGEDWKLRQTLNKKLTKASYAEREVLAYKIDRYLGLNKTPETIYKKIKNNEGSLQLFITDCKVNRYKSMTNDDRFKMGIFDYIIGNTDRGWHNYLFTKKNNLVFIDNGLSFPQPLKNKLGLWEFRNWAVNTNQLVDADVFTVSNISPSTYIELKNGLLNLEKNIKNELKNFNLSKKEIDCLFLRIKEVKKALDKKRGFEFFDNVNRKSYVQVLDDN